MNKINLDFVNPAPSIEGCPARVQFVATEQEDPELEKAISKLYERIEIPKFDWKPVAENQDYMQLVNYELTNKDLNAYNLLKNTVHLKK